MKNWLTGAPWAAKEKSEEKQGRHPLPFSPVKVHESLMSPEQTFLHGRAYASPLGVLPSLSDDTVAVVLPALNTHKLRDRLGGRLP